MNTTVQVRLPVYLLLVLLSVRSFWAWPFPLFPVPVLRPTRNQAIVFDNFAVVLQGSEKDNIFYLQK